MDRRPENCHPREKIDQEVDQISGKGGNRAEDDEFSGRGGGSHEHLKCSGLLRLLHRAQERLRAHNEEGIETCADKQEGEVLHTIGAKTGTDGAGEEIESRQFGEHSYQGYDETTAVADGGQQIAPQYGMDFVQSRNHKCEICDL